MTPLLLPVLVASLVGSPHCAGMCGGFVCFYSGQGSSRRRWLGHAAYNLGRLASYVAWGAASGALGSGVERMGAAAGIQRGSALFAGSLMLLWGGMGLLRAAGVHPPMIPGGAGGASPIAGLVRTLRARGPEVCGLGLGLASTLLPCGWLYTFVATAAGTGSPLGGMLVMTAFWAGTLPVMAGLGVATQRAFGPMRRYLPAATAGFLMVLGLLTLAGKLQPGPGGTAVHAVCAPHVAR